MTTRLAKVHPDYIAVHDRVFPRGLHRTEGARPPHGGGAVPRGNPGSFFPGLPARGTPVSFVTGERVPARRTPVERNPRDQRARHRTHQRRADAATRLRRVPGPGRRDRHRREGRPRSGLPQHRHRRRLRQREGRRPGHRRVRHRPRRAVRHHQAVELRPGLRLDAQGVRREHGQARPGAAGPT